MKKFLALCAGSLMTFAVSAQTATNGAKTVTTGVSFLTITPDARSSAMGEVGVSTSPDFYSQYSNAAKYVQMNGSKGIALSHSPWLKKITSDMSISSLYGYYRIDKNQSVGAGLKYFNMGKVTVLKNERDIPLEKSPYEFALDVSYSRYLSEHVSGGIALRYIYSNITGGDDENFKAGNSFAADISFYGNHELGNFLGLSWGTAISNIGPKISYQKGKEYFLPTNLKLGTTLTKRFDKQNSLGFTIEINKLLVPGSEQEKEFDKSRSIAFGSENNKGFLSGMFTAFGEKGIALSGGVEYNYSDQIYLRTGSYLESERNGGRKFGSIGLGARFNLIVIDCSYLVPFRSNSPLTNTLRFSVGLNVQ